MRTFFKGKKLQKGYTIVELLIYMGIVAVLLGVLSTTLFTLVDVQLESDATSSVQLDGRYMLARLRYDIRRADSISSPALGAQSPTLVLTINGSQYTYGVNANGDFAVTSPTGTDVYNSYDTSLQNVSFAHDGSSGTDTVQFSYTIKSRTENTSGDKSQTFSSTIGLR